MDQARRSDAPPSQFEQEVTHRSRAVLVQREGQRLDQSQLRRLAQRSHRQQVYEARAGRQAAPEQQERGPDRSDPLGGVTPYRQPR